MSVQYFNCPDYKTRTVEECLRECPRQEGRCLSLPTLMTIVRTSSWTGIPTCA